MLADVEVFFVENFYFYESLFCYWCRSRGERRKFFVELILGALSRVESRCAFGSVSVITKLGLSLAPQYPANRGPGRAP